MGRILKRPIKTAADGVNNAAIGISELVYDVHSELDAAQETGYLEGEIDLQPLDDLLSRFGIDTDIKIPIRIKLPSAIKKALAEESDRKES